MKRIVILALAAGLAGCVSGYTRFYHPVDGASPERIAATRANPAPTVPRLDHWSGTPDDANKAYVRQGYVAIGWSSFNGAGGVSDNQAVSQGQKVGADLVVVIDPQYTGTQSSVVPIVTPTSNTSVTNGTATAYGPSGVTTAYGTATTTTYGTRTNYVPISTDRFDYGAIYYVKGRVVLGIQSRDLNDQERQALGTNHGAVITSVLDGSPAFDADILTGDVVMAINGERVTSALLRQRINELKGQAVSLMIRRGGSDIEKSVTLHN